MQSRNLKFTDTVEPAWWSFANRTGTCTTQNTNYQTGTAKKPRHNWSFGIILKRRVASSWSMTTFGRGWHVALQHHPLEDWPNNKVPQKLIHQRFQYNNFQHTTTTQFGATHTHTHTDDSFTSLHIVLLSKFIHQPFKNISKHWFYQNSRKPRLGWVQPNGTHQIHNVPTSQGLGRKAKVLVLRRAKGWCKKWMNIFFGYVWIICI